MAFVCEFLEFCKYHSHNGVVIFWPTILPKATLRQMRNLEMATGKLGINICMNNGPSIFLLFLRDICTSSHFFHLFELVCQRKNITGHHPGIVFVFFFLETVSH